MHNFPRHTQLLLLAGLCALPVCGAVAADAQEPTLQSVTVTATRREESLQKVPVAVSVLEGEQLERDNRNGVAEHRAASTVAELSHRRVEQGHLIVRARRGHHFYLAGR